jgi:hypothetical protein
MSLFAVRVLVPFLRPVVVGAWCFGLGWVTKEETLCSNRKASQSTRFTFR